MAAPSLVPPCSRCTASLFRFPRRRRPQPVLPSAVCRPSQSQSQIHARQPARCHNTCADSRPAHRRALRAVPSHHLSPEPAHRRHHGRSWAAQPARHQYVPQRPQHLHRLHRPRPPSAAAASQQSVGLTRCSHCRRWPLQARCLPYVPAHELPPLPFALIPRLHTRCRLPGSLRCGHDQWRADAHHERHQEDVEPLLERELRYVRHPTSIPNHTHMC